jgi:hypothetical protein
MKPFAKMQSALPEPSGFAAARLLDFSLFQSGAFAADAFGVGGVFHRFSRAAAIRFARAARSLALMFFGTPLPILPSACAALFIVSIQRGVGAVEEFRDLSSDERAGLVTGIPATVGSFPRKAFLDLGNFERAQIGDDLGDCASGLLLEAAGVDVLLSVILAKPDVSGSCLPCIAGRVVVGVGFVHGRTVKRFTESVTNYFQKSFSLGISSGGGGGSETSAPSPREKSNILVYENRILAFDIALVRRAPGLGSLISATLSFSPIEFSSH